MLDRPTLGDPEALERSREFLCCDAERHPLGTLTGPCGAVLNLGARVRTPTALWPDGLAWSSRVRSKQACSRCRGCLCSSALPTLRPSVDLSGAALAAGRPLTMAPLACARCSCRSSYFAAFVVNPGRAPHRRGGLPRTRGEP